MGDEDEQEWKIMVHVLNKVVPVFCGSGNQTLQWLSNVGIARYDEDNSMGFLSLGFPTRICNQDEEELNFSSKINQVLEPKEHVFVSTSRS